jgi:hypothetical protein
MVEPESACSVAVLREDLLEILVYGCSMVLDAVILLNEGVES